jgi:hypothetical protein
MRQEVPRLRYATTLAASRWASGAVCCSLIGRCCCLAPTYTTAACCAATQPLRIDPTCSCPGACHVQHVPQSGSGSSQLPNPEAKASDRLSKWCRADETHDTPLLVRCMFVQMYTRTKQEFGTEKHRSSYLRWEDAPHKHSAP